MLNAPSPKSAFAVPGLLPAPTIEGRMLCASGLTYSIPSSSIRSKKLSQDFQIPKTDPFYAGVGYIKPPITIENGDVACTIGENKDGIIIAFRGTVYNSASKWLTDLMLVAKKGEGIPGKVHRGFYDNFMLIHKDIHSYFKNHLGKNIFITGHSNGAGIAPIAAYLLCENYNLIANQVFLFAPPNPGNPEFARAYNARFSNTFSYVNNGDIVSVLPPSLTLAEDLATCISSTKILSDEEKVLMNALLTNNSFLDYTHVGENIKFIKNSKPGKYSVETLTATTRNKIQFPEIKNIFSSDNFLGFAVANSHMCGYSYMNAICPTVTCPPYSSAN